MKLMHLSDLHIGKRLKDYSLIEDQKYIFEKILEIMDEEQPDVVMIAGDVYDKPVPSAEAVSLFDEFLFDLSKRNKHIFVISGNHDSPERIAFGGRLMASGIHMSPVYDGTVEPVLLDDEYGKIGIYMMPFVKPVHVRQYFEDETILNYTDAMRVAIENMNVDEGIRNVLITHQFVTGSQLDGDEELSVGGTDNVDASVFAGFDYVALGHIHRAQNAGGKTIRYSGTPLKYSFSENSNKSVTFVDLGVKGQVEVYQRELEPLRDMVRLEGSFAQMTDRNYGENRKHENDYVQVVLTDEDDIPDAYADLRKVFNRLMFISYNNKRTSYNQNIDGVDSVDDRKPYELFEELYRKQNNMDLSEDQRKIVNKMIEEIWEGEE